MARSFDKELGFLNDTYAMAIAEDVKPIERFLQASYGMPVISIGSGGSYSAAKAFECFHQINRTQGLAKAVTPFELAYFDLLQVGLGVILFSASGNNSDITNAFARIKSSEPKAFLSLCTKTNSKLKRLAVTSNSCIFFEKDLPHGKDGFLAVNSLVAQVVYMIKAYSNLFEIPFFILDEEFDFYKNNLTHDQSERVINNQSIVVLHGGFSTPVAIDLESKFSEAALGSVQLVDYRNFAHGRHNWIAQNEGRVSIVAFLSPNEEAVATKTLACIPNSIPRLVLATEKNNCMGMLELLREMFGLVQIAGRVKGIDPGKPHILEYGRKLYHISYKPREIDSSCIKKISQRAAFRKCVVRNSALNVEYQEAFELFFDKVTKTYFDGLIFDYDATLKDVYGDQLDEDRIFDILNEFLCKGLLIGIATGRGKSVRKELQEKLSSDYWDRVKIAYYNGGCIASLGDDAEPRNDGTINSSLNEISISLKRHALGAIQIDLRPQQLTITNLPLGIANTLRAIITETCSKYADVKILLSDHSIDIVPRETSKSNILRSYLEPDDLRFICFGDSGNFSGNDYELLSEEFGISVLNVSSSFECCWNFAPIGISKVKALRYYLESLEIRNRQLVMLANKL